MRNNLTLREPELSFDGIHQELNNFLRDTFMESAFSHPLSLKKNFTWRPAVEMKETPKEYKIKVQLPGANKDDIQIDLNTDYMTLTAEVKEEKTEVKDEEKLSTSEFRYGKYVRTIAFENPIKTEDAHAVYKNGILNIKLPKQEIKNESSKTLKIE